MTLEMSELREQMTDLAEALQIPAPREMPRAAFEAQRRLVLATIASRPGEAAPARRGRIGAALRALIGRLGLLSVLVAFICLAAGAANAGTHQQKVLELAAAGGAVTTITAVAATRPTAAGAASRRLAHRPITARRTLPAG